LQYAGKSAGLEKEGKLIKQARTEAKTGFYAFLNQAGAKTMSSTFAGYGIEVTEEFCKELIDILRSTYSGLYQGIKKHIKKANSYNLSFSDKYYDLDGKPVQGEYGVIRSLSGGRNYCKKIEFKDTYSKSTKKDVPFTDTISFMWLATEATVMKMALGRLHEEFHKNPEWGAYLCNFTHDEVNIICNNFKNDEFLIFSNWEWEFQTREDLGESLGIVSTDVCAVCSESVAEKVANLVGSQSNFILLFQ
jgi:hypothetical protein